jgi:hypothetical protein
MRISAFSIGLSLFPSINFPARMAKRCGAWAAANIGINRVDKATAANRRMKDSSRGRKPIRDQRIRRHLATIPGFAFGQKTGKVYGNIDNGAGFG